MDLAGNNHNNDLNVVREVSLSKLDALETLGNYPIHTVSAITVTPEDQLTNITSLLKEPITPLLSGHDKVFTYLASVIASAPRGASNQVQVPSNNNDDDTNDSTNTNLWVPLILLLFLN